LGSVPLAVSTMLPFTTATTAKIATQPPTILTLLMVLILLHTDVTPDGVLPMERR
jgi:uncharacterized membrane protein